MKVYKCEICGNIAVKLVDSGVDIVCCGQEMVELTINTVDGAGEKHVPVVETNENEYIVKVGEVEHPMEDAHYIQFIILEYENGYDVKFLNPGEKPEARFLTDEKVLAVYEYCNLHGLWKADV